MWHRIMPRVYIRSKRVTICTEKRFILQAATGVWKISSVAYGFSSIKTDHFDYKKSIYQQNKLSYVFFNEIYFIEQKQH